VSRLFRMAWAITFCLMLPFSGAVLANEAAPLADDPVVEQRLITISEELRCLVCQNESLAGSRADLALDLRRELRTLIKAGKSDAEIMDFMVSRYGDFVLYRPPVKPITYVLWFGPFLLLIGAIFLMMRLVRASQGSRPTAANDSAPTLSAAQRAKAQALLNDVNPDRPS
jgi:cytochrome c-type biogenesis protein CcmH